MADVSVKMGVSGISQFKQGMADAAASVKTLDAAMKTNEKQLKATGDAEAFMASQTNLLQGKISALRNVAKNAEQALKQMEANGVQPTSRAYQDMQRKLVEAQGSILDAEQEMQNLGKSAVEAAGQTDQLATSLGGLNKRVSLEQVIGAVNSITTGMEKAAKKAVDLGKAIWENITDTARYSDDIATQAMQTNMGIEEFQQWKGALETYGELTVQEWQKAKLKVQKAIQDPTADQTGIFDLLGIQTHGTVQGKDGIVQGAARDFEEVFWEIGQTLQRKVKSGELTQDTADLYANAIFGRGFTGLNSIFDMGQEEFQKKVDAQAKASKEAIKKNEELNDALEELQRKFKALETETLSGLAPALTDAANALGGLLNEVLEYLQTPEGQKALEDLGTAASGLFDDLGEIDPDKVVEGFTKVFNGIISGVQWLVDNEQGVIDAMKGIVTGWGLLKLTGGALQIAKLFEGITGMAGGGAASAGAAAGASWGAAFAAAVAKAAPWLVGAYALLSPAEGGNDSPFDNKTGMMTNEGWRQFEDYANGRIKDEAWDEIIQLVGDRYGGLSDILANPAAINAMAKALYGDHNFIGIDPMAQPDAYRTRINNELFDTLEGMGYEPKIEIEPSEEVKGILEKGTIELTVGDPTGRIKTPSGWKEPEVDVKPTVPSDEAVRLSQEIGTVILPAQLQLMGIAGAASIGANGVAGDLEKAWRQSVYDKMYGRGFANGLPTTPFDGWYFLHKDETVTPAREIAHRSYNSNLYIENMNMNNGQDADGLAARIDAQNRRTMSGYGS